jgi:hypothetical protein
VLAAGASLARLWKLQCQNCAALPQVVRVQVGRENHVTPGKQKDLARPQQPVKADPEAQP